MRFFVWYFLMMASFVLTVILGYLNYSIILTVPLVLINTFICYRPLKSLRHPLEQSSDESPMLDVLFLLFQQTLVIVFFYMVAGLLLGLLFPVLGFFDRF